MPEAPPQPQYEDTTLAAMSVPELIQVLIREEDQVPRNVIDACAQRGSAMVEALRDVLTEGRGWAFDEYDQSNDDQASLGDWWLLHHAMMILGLIPDESAGLLLTDCLRRIDEEDDMDMADWLSGRWPALFRNKPATVLPALGALSGDTALNCYVRTDALEAMLDRAQLEGASLLDEALDWAASLASNEDEDEDYRLLAGNAMLKFAPARHRHLLEALAAEQPKIGAIFTAKHVEEAYTEGGLETAPHHFDDPWTFYSPEQARERLQRWMDEDASGETATIVRDGPKVGRNDPCPCGSGKKYKKCCLDKA